MIVERIALDEHRAERSSKNRHLLCVCPAPSRVPHLLTPGKPDPSPLMIW